MWKYNSADNSFAGHLFFGVDGGGGCIAYENRTVAGCVCAVCYTLLLYHSRMPCLYIPIFVLFLFSFFRFLI